MKFLTALLFMVSVFSPAMPFVVPAAAAGEVTITATVDKTRASLDDYLLLQVAVEGTREEPAMPDLGPFKFQSRGTSTQMTVINGRMSSKLQYTYVLYPQKTGTFTIGPFTVDDEGTTVKSAPITVTVTRAAPNPGKSDEVYVTASVDNANPYLNQQIIYLFRFYRRVRVAGASLSEQPSFDGFIVERLGKEREYQQVVSGQQYLVTEVRYALFPVKTGVLEISPTTLEASVVVKKRSQRRPFGDPFFDDSFFGFNETVPRSFRTGTVTVMVKPLPAEGRPDDFRGLVGSFTLTGDMSEDRLTVGQSATLTLTLSGTGNLKNHQSIDIGPLDDFKVYDDKPVFEPLLNGENIGGRLVIKKALVPLSAGSLSIPAVTVSFFDPSTGSYKRAGTNARTVVVSPSQGDETLSLVQARTGDAARKQEVEVLVKDVLPIHTTHESLAAVRLLPSLPWILMVLFAPAVCFLSLLTVRMSRSRFSADPAHLRARKAYKQFRKNLPEVRRSLERGDGTFYQAASRVVRDYLGDRLNTAGTAITAQDLARLQGAKLTAEIIEDLTAIFQFLDSGQYGYKEYSRDEQRDVFTRMQQLVLRIDRRLR